MVGPALAAAAIASALLVAVVALPSTAAAASGPRILSPKSDALAGSATLRVRVKARGPGFSAIVGSRTVTKRFGRARGGVRTAVLRRRRDFSLGRNRLLVTAPGGSDAVVFVAARRRHGMLKLRRRPRGASRAAVHLRGHVARDFDEIRVRLNGRRVPRRLWPRGKRSFEALLGADEGARFGRNRLVATVLHHDGVYDWVVRRFRISRRAPLAGAGPDRRTKTRRPVRLDGGTTRRSPRGSRVAYRWRIVRAPKGSNAKLRRSRSARPTLRPDKRGVYRIRLVAATRRKGRARASASGSSTDQVSVQAAPNVGPIGVPIQTIARGGGVQIGGQTYATNANWVQVLLADRATLEVTQNVGFNIDEALELFAFLDGQSKQNPHQLVIMSGGGRSFLQNMTFGIGWTASNSNILEEAFGMLGGDRDPDGPLFALGLTLVDGAWSLIGQFGLPAGTANQNHQIVTGGDGQPGSLTGYMQLDQFNNYAFVSPDSVVVDTNVPGAPVGTNQIKVGDKVYPSSGTIPPGSGGFQVLVLDGQLNLVTNQTFETNSAGGPNDAGIGGMNAVLNSQRLRLGSAAQNLVIVQSIGQIGGYDPAWANDEDGFITTPDSWRDSLAGAIGQFGGLAAHDQFASIVAPSQVQTTPQMQGGYTLVASAGLTDRYDDAWSQTQAGSRLQSARVVGSISRNRDSQWVMQSPSAVSGFDTGALPQLAYQTPTAWPLSGGAYDTASRWIARQLDFTAPDVRTAYYENAGGDWGDDLYRQLQDLPYEAGNGFSAEQFSALKTQLLREFTMVSEVWTMIDDWQRTFGNSSFSNYVNLQSIAATIVNDISAEQQIDESKSSIDPLAVVGASLWLAQGISGITGQEEAEVWLGVAAASIDLIDATAQDQNGEPSIAPVEDEAQDLGGELATRYQELSNNLAQLGNLFVSDWGKLQTAARNSNGIWESNSTNSANVQETMTRAANVAFYTELIPLAYGQYVLEYGPSDINSAPWQDPWNYRCQSSDGPNTFTYPFTPTQQNPASYVIGALRFGDIGGGVIDTFRQVRIISTPIDWIDRVNEAIEHEPQVLPNDISGTLFQPTSTDTGLGMDQFRFFGNPAFNRWGLSCNNE